MDRARGRTCLTLSPFKLRVKIPAGKDPGQHTGHGRVCHAGHVMPGKGGKGNGDTAAEGCVVLHRDAEGQARLGKGARRGQKVGLGVIFIARAMEEVPGEQA